MDSAEMQKVRRYAAAKERVIEAARKLNENVEDGGSLYHSNAYRKELTDALFELDMTKKPRGVR